MIQLLPDRASVQLGRMTTARISAAPAAALVTAGTVTIGPAAAPARAYGPASCVPGDPTRPTGELFATTDTATITDPADSRLNEAQFRYGDREFACSTDTDALACAV